MLRRSLTTLTLAVALLWAGTACAQSPTPDAKAPSAGEERGSGPNVAADKPGEKDQSPKVKVERSAGGRKVFRITTGFVIEGRIQKPNAFYVLQRSQINYDWARLSQDFTPRIVDSVNASPF